MFFVFLILLFTFHITEINSITLRHNIIEYQNKRFVRKISHKDDFDTNTSSSSTNVPLFQTLQNSSRTRPPNLQSNMYDKVLLDEMFSIKQLKNRFIKNNTKSPILVGITALTPTFIPKWPTMKLSDVINSKTQNNEENKSGDEKHIRNLKELRDKNKFVKLRSISAEESKHHQDPSHNIPGRYCTCMKYNGFTTCSHREYEKMCTHTPKYDFRHESGILTPYPAIYLPYQSYFLSATTHNPYKITYYHPSIINELKVPKRKKHRYPTTTQYDDDLYYENSYNKAKDKYDTYLENNKPLDKVFQKPKKGEVLINIDYDVKNKGSKKPEQGTVKRDSDLHEVLNDLDSVYSDCAMKKCYCSSALRNMFYSFNIIPYVTFAALLR